MNLEQQVCNLELSKRLNELGVKQESLWCWQVYKTGDVYLIPSKDATGFIDKSDVCDYYSAFTVAELLNMLTRYKKSVTMPLDGKNYFANFLAEEVINEESKIQN